MGRWSLQPSKKRKLDDAEVTVGPTAAANGTSVKRNRPSEPGGLLARDKLKAALAKKNVKKLAEDQSAKEEDDAVTVGSEFDREEGADALSAALAAKLSTIKIQNGSKDNIKVTEVKMVGNGRLKTDKRRVSSLPFPVETRQACHDKWQRVSRATLIAWAACAEDPSWAISKLDKATALRTWDSVFPNITFEDKVRQDLSLKLIYLKQHAMRNLNESLGDCDLEESEIAAFVKQALTPDKWPFIYASPEGEAAAVKGAFQTAGAVASFTYGPLSGRLGLCVAVIERGASYWKAGVDKSFKLDKNTAKKPVSTFAEQWWGLSA
ncbi:hypothetical protein CVT26_009206 [Gymnopilus dilepis]|uniref:Uncharacterized protein n=1 Tax=Gymnopilus dilepis TaxID=231916 RepID=A0A409X4A9_9AGAR|nr:hypothetical protein CVT26_009206 [Gymnopilus dilepis]